MMSPTSATASTGESKWIALKFVHQSETNAGFLVPVTTSPLEIDDVFRDGHFCRDVSDCQSVADRLVRNQKVIISGAVSFLNRKQEVFEDYDGLNLALLRGSARRPPPTRSERPPDHLAPGCTLIKFRGQRSTFAGMIYPLRFGFAPDIPYVLRYGIFVRSREEIRQYLSPNSASTLHIPTSMPSPDLYPVDELFELYSSEDIEAIKRADPQDEREGTRSSQ